MLFQVKGLDHDLNEFKKSYFRAASRKQDQLRFLLAMPRGSHPTLNGKFSYYINCKKNV